VSSPLSLQRTEVPPAPASQPQLSQRAVAPLTVHDGSGQPTEKSTVLPATMQRLIVARTRIYEAARAGLRIRTYEVALDLDMSEFHFARAVPPRVRALAARLLRRGPRRDPLGECSRGAWPKAPSPAASASAAPAELRALLGKRPAGTLPPDLARV
jgi:hypothetical protein